MSDDDRDKTIFIEYYPSFVLAVIWNNNGTVDQYHVSERERVTV